jgi:hypothetical protein
MKSNPQPSSRPVPPKTRRAQQGSTKTPTTKADEGYDNAVHAGELDEEDDDIFERLERAEVNVDGDVSENVDPEDLVAELEGKADGESPDSVTFEASDLEQGQIELTGIALKGLGNTVEDEDGPISPEEMGEQFLRGAAQQERSTHTNDRESNDNVDLLSESVHQVSLFDHNQDPLAEPRLPRVVTDKAEAKANRAKVDDGKN